MAPVLLHALSYEFVHALAKGLHNSSFEMNRTLGTEKSRFAPFPVKTVFKILFGPSVPALPPIPNPF